MNPSIVLMESQRMDITFIYDSYIQRYNVTTDDAMLKDGVEVQCKQGLRKHFLVTTFFVLNGRSTK